MYHENSNEEEIDQEPFFNEKDFSDQSVDFPEEFSPQNQLSSRPENVSFAYATAGKSQDNFDQQEEVPFQDRGASNNCIDDDFFPNRGNKEHDYFALRSGTSDKWYLSFVSF